MQSPNPLIALGISTVVAVSAITTASANAEPGMRHRSTPANGESTQASSTPSSPQTTAQQPSDAQQRAADRLDQLQTESQIRQQLNQSRFEPSSRPLTTGSNALQLDQQIQQQLNTQDLQNLRQGVGTSPSRSLDRLQFEQRIRQQLQQPRDQPQSQASALPTEAVAAEAAKGEAAQPETAQVSATQTDTTQTDTTQTAQTSVEPTATEQSATEQRPVDEPKRRNRRTRRHTTEQNAQAEPNPASDSAIPAAVDQPVARTEADSRPQALDAESPAEPTESIELTEATETDEATPANEAKADQTADETVDATEATEANEAKADETADATEAAEATETAESAKVSESPESNEVEAVTETAETDETVETVEDTQSTETAETEPAEAESAETEPTEAERQDRTETAQTPNEPPSTPSAPSNSNRSGDSQRIDFDTFSLNNSPAPEYLDPSPNPLFLPTQPDEVELAGTQPITLRQAIELAIRNNPDLQQQRLTLERTQADLRNVQAANFPTLDALANFAQSGQQTATQAPDTLGIDPTTGEDVPNPNAGEVNRDYQDSTALGAGLELNYNIYTSGRRSSLVRASQGQVRLQQLEIERQTEQLILETIGNYYDLQQAGAQVNIFRANLVQAEQSLRDAQALERAGVGTRFDVLQADVDVANARQRLTQQLSDLEVARRELVRQLNLSQSLNVSAADPIEVSGVWDLSLEESIVQGYKNRAELEQQLIQREIAQNNRRAALAQLGPQVGLNGTFNVVNNLDQNAGFTYNYQVALQASLALFDGGAARAQANREESNIAIADSQFEATRDQIRFDIERGYSQLNASFANIQTTALAVEQAAEALRLARLRFQAGVGTQTDVLRQQSVLAEAQVNNLSAILDYNRALAVLQRGVSNFPEGYLNDQP